MVAEEAKLPSVLLAQVQQVETVAQAARQATAVRPSTTPAVEEAEHEPRQEQAALAAAEQVE